MNYHMYHHLHHRHSHSWGHNLFEVCSSFYTNNPLLYVSHYSEIIVSTGYDVPQRGPPGMLRQSLSSRRELVEQLDAEPLFGYLLQNGVVDAGTIADIQHEKTSAKVNLALLRKVETSGKMAESLFVNALRQSGQLHLASLLDDSTRLKKLSGSGL